MNRWLKYGGIMPDIINTSTLTPTEGYYINDQGTIVASNNFHYYLIRLKPGKYKFKFYCNRWFSRSRIRVIQYDLNNEYVATLVSYYLPEQAVANTMYTFTAEFTTESIIGLSSHTNATLMEIEKL